MTRLDSGTANLIGIKGLIWGIPMEPSWYYNYTPQLITITPVTPTSPTTKAPISIVLKNVLAY